MIERVRKKWMLSLDGGVTFDQEVFPINTQSVKYPIAQDLKAGQIAFRKKLNTKLRFGETDFDFFYSWERTPVRRCQDLYIRQDRLCEGRWFHFWTGKFTVGKGSFDLDACQCEFKIETFDKYACVVDHFADKVNVMAIPAVTISANILPTNVEFAVCVTEVLPVTEDPDIVCDPLYPPSEGWLDVGDEALGTDDSARTYVREKVVVDCVGGVSTAPPGIGWLLIADNCDVDGTAIYARIPDTSGWGIFGPAEGTCVGGIPTPPAGDGWILIKDCMDGLPPLYFIITGDAIDYERSRSLLTITEFLLEKTGCEIGEVQSDFFEWNPPGDTAGYSAGINYVTGRPNQVNALHFVQKSDAIDPLATNPATIGQLTLRELLEFYRKAFNVFWDIDSQGNFRLEHYKAWTQAEGIDITSGDNFELNRGMNRYEHLTAEIPPRERLSFQEALGADFIGLDIIYGSCVDNEDKEEVEEVRISNITSDLAFINTDPTSISKLGFAAIATDGSNVINDIGAISDTVITNAPLSVANLQRDYWTWNRYLKKGNMNGADVIFDGIVPNIQQPDLKVRFCCGMEEWEPRDTIKTELGEKFLQHRQARVEKAELEDFDDRLTITPRYAY